MASEPLRYQRLSRPYLGLNGTASLWVGDDHLLQVTGRAGWEQYRRWFFRDIQALIARQTPVRLIWNIVVGLGGLFIAFGAVLVGNTTSTSTGERTALIVIAAILGTIAVVFLLVALVNTLLGPSCAVYVQTSLGTEKLSAPGRLPAFNRIVHFVRPLAERAQTQPDTSGLAEIGPTFDQTANP